MSCLQRELYGFSVTRPPGDDSAGSDCVAAIAFRAGAFGRTARSRRRDSDRWQFWWCRIDAPPRDAEMKRCSVPGWQPPARSTKRCRLHVDTGKDRKSTRLNSSHLVISYAVFCLNKKYRFLITLWSTSVAGATARPVAIFSDTVCVDGTAT